MTAVISVLVDSVVCEFSLLSSGFRGNCRALYFEVQLESFLETLQSIETSVAVYRYIVCDQKFYYCFYCASFFYPVCFIFDHSFVTYHCYEFLQLN